MNLKVNQNLPAIDTNDEVALWYQNKWFKSEESLLQAQRQLTKLREQVTKEKKRNEGGPDIFVMQEDDNPLLKDYEEKFSQLTQRIIVLREENEELQVNTHVKQVICVDHGQVTDIDCQAKEVDPRIAQHESSIQQLTADIEALKKKLSGVQVNLMQNQILLKYKDIEKITAVQQVTKKFVKEKDQLRVEYDELDRRHSGLLEEKETHAQSMATQITERESMIQQLTEQYAKMKQLNR